MFIGRKEELKELNDRLESGKFEMGVVYGSRRIGKTSLLKEFIRDKSAFYFQAKESNELDNRTAFSVAVNKCIGIPYSMVYPSFSAGFDELLKFAGDKPFVIVIDEIAFLAKSDKGLMSELQYCVDHKFKDTQVKFILSGSNISFMKDILQDKRAPLFQRSTFQISVRKMYFSDALKFLDGVSSEEKIKYLSIFGEHPFYLEMIDKTKPFEDNLRRLLFSRFGNLVDAPDKILPSASNDQNMYNTILKAIAHRKRTNKEIAAYIGKEPNFVAAYLPKLVENEVIEKKESFNRNQKMNYYEISDNLIRFWYRFIFDNKEEILLNMGEQIFEGYLEKIELFITQAFEDVALSYLSELNAKRKLPYNYGIIRGYKVENSKLGRSIELDGLAKGIGSANNRLLVVECKYRSKPFTVEMLEHLKESVSIFNEYDYYDYYLFSKAGFDEHLLEYKNLHLIRAEDMFEGMPH